MGLRATDYLIDDDTPLVPLSRPVVAGRPRSLGLVPRDHAVDPPEMFDPPSELALVPRSEWSARIRELEQNQALLSHVRGSIPSLDQGQNGYCHDEQTEVLTEKGWVRWPDYNWTDLLGTVGVGGLLEFQRPFERHVYEYDGEMVHCGSRRVNFAVTPDHRMVVRRWDERARTLSGDYTVCRAGDIGWYSGLMHAPSGFIGTELVEVGVEGDRTYDGDDFLALLALVVSDGYAGGTENTRNWVSFASFREDRRDEVAALAARVGFRECPGRPGVWIRYDAGALAAWVRANCYTNGDLGAQNKRVPDIVKSASMRQIKHFLWQFDDRNRSGLQYYSTSRRVMDDLQDLFLRVGKRSAVDGVRPKSTEHRGKTIRSGESFILTVSRTDRLCIERKHSIGLDRYKGPVYCAAVPNGTLVTRRDGTVLISGNCWAHSTAHATTIVRALNNQPYVPLSAYAVASIIKGGRNEGGWCGQSAQFLREVGIPPQSLWPQGSRDLRHDTPAMRAEAAKYRTTEDWYDLTRPIHGQVLTFDQVMSLLLSGIPCALDFNWWGHSVCGLDPVEVEPGSFGIRIWNSWSDAWGDRGMGVLRGNRAIPDGAVATRVVGAVAPSSGSGHGRAS